MKEAFSSVDVKICPRGAGYVVESDVKYHEANSKETVFYWQIRTVFL
jgi:hypothetical protein